MQNVRSDIRSMVSVEHGAVVGKRCLRREQRIRIRGVDIYKIRIEGV